MKATRRREPSVGQVAREEFWIVAKTFFAPVYLMVLLWRRLSRGSRPIDGKDRKSPAAPWLTPAE